MKIYTLTVTIPAPPMMLERTLHFETEALREHFLRIAAPQNITEKSRGEIETLAPINALWLCRDDRLAAA